MVTRHNGYSEARRLSSAALVRDALPVLSDMRLKIAILG